MAKPTLILRPSTACLSNGKADISEGTLTGWKSTSLEILWEVNFVNTGELKVTIELSNVRCLAGAQIEAEIDDQVVCGSTMYSGGWKKYEFMKLGNIILSKPGLFTVKIRAKALHGVLAGHLRSVILKGPAALDAAEDAIPTRADAIHFRYKDGGGCVLFYNRVKVISSYPGTCFVVCGFNRGFFGIQENDFKQKKTLCFSVWDPVSGDENDPDKVPEGERARSIARSNGIVVKRFGTVGTGCENVFEYDWKLNETYHFIVKIHPGKDRGVANYSGYFYINDTKQWKLIGTCQVKCFSEHLTKLYCFVEDYLGSYGKFEREAHFGPGWRQMPNGKWAELTKVYFTQSGCLPNIDAGNTEDGLFYLKTGGRIKQSRSVYSKLYAKSTELPEMLQNIETNN